MGFSDRENCPSFDFSSIEMVMSKVDEVDDLTKPNLVEDKGEPSGGCLRIIERDSSGMRETITVNYEIKR